MIKLKENWRKLAPEEKLATVIANIVIMSFFVYMSVIILMDENINQDWRSWLASLMIILVGLKLCYDNFLEKPDYNDFIDMGDEETY